MGTTTTNADLPRPSHDDPDWDVALQALIDRLDTVSAVANLSVRPTEFPSTTTNVKVGAGTWKKADGTVGTFPGLASYAVPNGQVTCLWLTDAGLFAAGTAWPTTAHVRLAAVTAAGGVVTDYPDAKANAVTVGTSTGTGYVLKTGDTMTGVLAIGTALGAEVLVADPSAAKLGFFGATPQTQAAALTAITDSTFGVASSTLVDVGTTFSQSQIDANFATLAAKVNALIAALKRHGLMST